MLPSPLFLRRASSSRAGGCIRVWVNAMRCRAALSWRLPVRDKRCRCLFDDQTGSGAVPLSRAKASLERNRPTWAGLAHDLCCGQCAAAHDSQQRWGDRDDTFRDLGGELVDLNGEQPQMLHQAQRQPAYQGVVTTRS